MKHDKIQAEIIILKTKIYFRIDTLTKVVWRNLHEWAACNNLLKIMLWLFYISIDLIEIEIDPNADTSLFDRLNSTICAPSSRKSARDEGEKEEP